MPFTPAEARNHKKDLTDAEASKWSDIANSVYSRCMAEKDNDSECAGMAIRVASAQINQSRKSAEAGGGHTHPHADGEGQHTHPERGCETASGQHSHRGDEGLDGSGHEHPGEIAFGGMHRPEGSGAHYHEVAGTSGDKTAANMVYEALYKRHEQFGVRVAAKRAGAMWLAMMRKQGGSGAKTTLQS